MKVADLNCFLRSANARNFLRIALFTIKCAVKFITTKAKKSCQRAIFIGKLKTKEPNNKHGGCF